MHRLIDVDSVDWFETMATMAGDLLQIAILLCTA